MATRLGTWKWMCPHCGTKAMGLVAARRHITHHHEGCVGCEAEMLLLNFFLMQPHELDGQTAGENSFHS